MILATIFAGYGLLSIQFESTQANIIGANLNLSEWNSHTLLKLDGEWRYYPLTRAKDIMDEGVLHDVPHIWDTSSSSDEPYDFYATYALHISGLDADQIYGLYLLDAGTSYQLFVDDQLIMSNGVVGTDASTQIPQQKASVGYFRPDASGDVILIMEISNFHNHRGGFWLPLTLGNQTSIHEIYHQSSVIETLLFAWFLAIGAVNLLIFFFSTHEKGALYLGLGAELIAARILLTGHRMLFAFFPDFPWVWVERLTYLFGMVLLPIAGLLLIHFNIIKPKPWMRKIYFLLTTMIIVYPFLMNYDVQRIGFTLFQYITVIALIFIFIQVLLAVIHRIQGAIAVLFTLIFLILAVVVEFFFGGPIYYLFFSIFVVTSSFTIIIIDEFLTSKKEKQKLQNVIIKDPLTDVYNRLYLDQLLRGEIQFKKTSKFSYIIFIDLDKFKNFNDDHGHLIGDQILIQTAKRIDRIIASIGVTIRYGGDEFLAIASLNQEVLIQDLIIKLQSSISQPITVNGKDYQVMGSLGYSAYDLIAEHLEQAIRMSDQDMYQKKHLNNQESLQSRI